MEVHYVSEEERYVGPDGVKRPWGWVSADGPPPKYDDERGPFGKASGRSKARSGTPAAKRTVDPNILAVDQMFKDHIAENKARLSTSASQSAIKRTSSNRDLETQPSQDGSSQGNNDVASEPTEMILCGFDSAYQWAAIDKFERCFGRICEDYPRSPPQQYGKFKFTMNNPDLNHGPRNQAEAAKTMKYAGGNHWIKVTFENANFAHQAVTNTQPIIIYSRRVFCDYYKGVGPREDKPIDQNVTSRPVPSLPSGSSFAESGSLGRYASNSTSAPTGDPSPSLSSSTASSATATGAGETTARSSSRRLSPRRSTQRSASPTENGGPTLSLRGNRPNRIEKEPKRYLTDMPRRPMMPAEMALRPMPSWWERQSAKMPTWLTSEIIGSAVPKNDNGEFDWLKASIYWKFWFMIDYYLGTDLCGLRDDD